MHQCNVCEVRLQHKIMVWLHFPPKCRFPQEVQVAGAPPALCLAIPQISRLCPEIVQIDCSHLSAKHQIGLPVRDSSNLLPKNHHKFLFCEPEVLGLSRPLSLAFGPSGRLVSPKIQKNPENTLSCDGSFTLPKNSKFSSYPYLHLHDYAVHVHVDHHRLDPEDISPPDTMSYSKPEQMSDQEFYISVEQVSEHQTKIS